MGHGGEFWQNVVHWRREWQTTSVFLPWTPCTVWKGKMTGLKDELPRFVGAQYATGDQWRNNSRKMKRWSQSKNNTQLWMWLVIEVKFDAVKSPFCGLENNAFIDKQVHTTGYNLLIFSDKYTIPSIFVWCKTAWWGYSCLDYGAILVVLCHMFGSM